MVARLALIDIEKSRKALDFYLKSLLMSSAVASNGIFFTQILVPVCLSFACLPEPVLCFLNKCTKFELKVKFEETIGTKKLTHL